MSVVNRHRLPLAALFAANLISLTGNVLALLAIPWFVLETTGSASRTGITGAVGALPFVVAGIFGGALVDRFGFKRMSIIADVASGLTVALIPLLDHTVGLAFWQLLVLVFLGGLLDAPGTTARAGLLPDLARDAGMRLERVNALEQTVSRLTYLLGPPLAGVLIAAIGPGDVLWLNAGSFAISAAIVALLVPGADRPAARARGTYFGDLRAGWRYIRGERLIFTIIVFVLMTNFLDAAMALVYPVYAERELGSAVHLGLMMAAFGAGAVATTIAFAVVGHRLPRRETYIFAFVLTALPIFVLAATPAFALVLGAMVVRGFGAGPLNPIISTVEQERIPAEMRGRVFGLIGASAWLMIPAGRVVGGYAIEGIGLPVTVLALASAYTIVTISMLFIPAFRQFDGPQSEPNRRTATGRTTRMASATGGRD
jgi:MFS family permease